MEDILDNDGYRSLSARDKVAWIDLLATFNRQRAERTGNVVILPWSSAMRVFGAQHHAHVVARAARMARAVDAHFARVPRGLLCYVPKWSKLQGFTPTRLRRGSDATPTTTPTTTHTPTGSNSPRRKRREPTPIPPWAERGAELLAAALKARIPGARTSPKPWAREIAKIDAPEAEVLESIQWLYSPANEGQYRIEVQSGATLVKKYGQVRAAIRRNNLPSAGERPDPKLERIRMNVEKSRERERERYRQQAARRIGAEAEEPRPAAGDLPER